MSSFFFRQQVPDFRTLICARNILNPKGASVDIIGNGTATAIRLPRNKPEDLDKYYPRQFVMRFLVFDPKEGIRIAEPYYGLTYEQLLMEKAFINDPMPEELRVNPAYLDYLEDMNPEYRLQEEAHHEGYLFKLPNNYGFDVVNVNKLRIAAGCFVTPSQFKSRVEAYGFLRERELERRRDASR